MSLTTPTVEDRPAPWQVPSPLPDERHTHRLTLRFWRVEDAPGMLAAIDADRGSLLPWLPWAAVDNQTAAECIYQIERMRRARERPSPAPDDFTLAIVERESGEIVGGTGLHRLRADDHQAEIGYWVRADRRGRSMCTEAVAGLISWAFTDQREGGWGLRRIEIFCARRNLASQRVPQKLGLRQEVHRRQAGWIEGLGWEDQLGWGVVRDEWRPRTEPPA